MLIKKRVNYNGVVFNLQVRTGLGGQRHFRMANLKTYPSGFGPVEQHIFTYAEGEHVCRVYKNGSAIPQVFPVNLDFIDFERGIRAMEELT